MLTRELYRGRIIWNRTQRIMKGGTRAPARLRPRSGWLTIDAPDLRIVPDDLWEAALRQRRAAFTGFPRRADGTFLGRPSGADRGSRYLLTGIASCAICRGSIVGLEKSHGAWRKFLYGCGHHHRRGAAICTNGVEVRQEVLDHAILDALTRLLDERMIGAAIQKALERLRSGQERTLDRRTQIQRELSLIEARERRLVQAIKEGAGIAPLVAELKAEEEHKATMVRELAGLDDVEAVASMEDTRLRRDVEAQAADVRRLMLEHVAKARQMLRKLDVRVVCEPFEEQDQKGYRYTLTGTSMRILGTAGGSARGVTGGSRRRVRGPGRVSGPSRLCPGQPLE